MRSLKNKSVFITGVCGTIGKVLVKQLLSEEYGIRELIGIDNDETGLFFLKQKYQNNHNANFFVMDIRDRDALINKIQNVDYIFHLAALKHVAICEESPDQAIKTNILGTQNIIDAANYNDVEVVLFTSSDKAVNPTNVMGTSKLMGERIITGANSNKRKGGPIFASTRFGNVLGSNGSVIPIFYNQIKNSTPVTLTDSKMTRFVMTVQQATELVINSSLIAKGGEVFVTKMLVMSIENLAHSMIEILSKSLGLPKVDIKNIGTKPGEKLYEELMSHEEIRRTIEHKNYYIILPAFRGIYNAIEYTYKDIVNERPSQVYTSEQQEKLSIDQIKTFLQENKLLVEPSEKTSFRSWPGG